MEMMQLNGDTGPRHLDKLKSMLGSMVKEFKRKRRHLRGRVIIKSAGPKLPRAVCDICDIPYDFAIQTAPGIPEVRRCGDCANMLKSGYTALVVDTKNPFEREHAWVKGGPFKPGEVITDISKKVMQKVKEKFRQDNSK